MTRLNNGCAKISIFLSLLFGSVNIYELKGYLYICILEVWISIWFKVLSFSKKKKKEKCISKKCALASSLCVCVIYVILTLYQSIQSKHPLQIQVQNFDYAIKENETSV